MPDLEARMTNHDNNALPELPGMHENNGLLCSFASRWKMDGDYIRCRTCKQPQLTSYADNDFPHSSDCRVKDVPTMERRPWLTYVELLAPLCRRAAGREEAVEFGHMFAEDIEKLRRGEWPQDIYSSPSEKTCQMTGRVSHTIPIYTRPAAPAGNGG
jgi:hypothetical protein